MGIAVWLVEFKPVLSDNLEGWDVVGGWRDTFTLMYAKKQHDTVIFIQLKINKFLKSYTWKQNRKFIELKKKYINPQNYPTVLSCTNENKYNRLSSILS